MAVSVLTLFALLSVLLSLAHIQADQFAWQGYFEDPTYGGNLTVCVSLVNGVYYGQALISDVGYLRGTIDSANVWSGDYFMAGLAAIRGTFTLTLNANSYSGSYTQSGSNIVYSVSNAAQLSSASPSDLECFRADDSMLTMTQPFDLTGALADKSGNLWYIAATGSSLTTSYTYEFADGTLSPGTSQGTTFLNGQIALTNFYEGGDLTGIDVIMAKNSSQIFNLWWLIPSISDFDYSTTSPSNNGFSSRTIISSISDAEVFENAYSNMCYALWTTSAEQSCISTGSSGDSNDDDSDWNEDVLITVVVFAVLSFVAIVATLIVVILRTSRPASLTSQAANPTL